MSNGMVKRLARNNAGSDWIVGDIHGTFGKLQAALDEHGFRPESGDRLISVGDLVDRGPESHLALEWLAKPWFHAVRGNHEQMAIEFAAGSGDAWTYQVNGGQWFLDLTDGRQRTFAKAFSEMPVAIEIETTEGLVGVVHAECPFPAWADFTDSLVDESLSLRMADAILEAAMWSRERITRNEDTVLLDVRAVVVGHTPMEKSVWCGNHIYIDTMGWRRGHFTLLDAETLAPAYAKRLSFA